MAALCSLASGALQAQAANPRTSRLIVPYPPGGIVDAAARILSPGLKQALAHEVVVENISGAAGTIGLQKLVDSLPEAQDVALGTDSDAILAPLTNPEVRFTPSQIRLVSVVSGAPMALVTGSAAPALPADAVVGNARAANAEFTCGNYGAGSNSQLVAQDLAERAGFRCVHVAYRGIAPLLQDLMGAQVQLSFVPLAAAIPDMIRAGKLRLLAVAADRRSPAFASVPTFAELGIPGFAYRSWNGLMVPASATQASVERVHAALVQTLREPAVRSQIEATQLEPAEPMSLAEAERFFAREVQKYAALVARSRAAPKRP